MASPMRKKRAWSTREDDAESEETAAFEAAVAAARDTAAKSGAFLSSAKSDLSEHQRWLKTQSAAVDRDRARHERWLVRQRDRRLAIERKEHKRHQRQVMRERASQAIHRGVGGSLLAVALFLQAITKTGAGIKYCGLLVVRGITSVAVGLRDATLFVTHAIAAGARSTGRAVAAGSRSRARVIAAGSRWTTVNLKALALAIGRMSSAGLVWTRAKVQSSARIGGAALATGSAVVSAKAQSSARVGGTALVAGSAVVAAKARVLTQAVRRSLGTGFSAASAKGATVAAAGGRAASHGLAVAGDIGAALGAVSKRRLSAGYAWSRAHARMVVPALSVGAVKAGRQAKRFAGAGAAHAKLGFEKVRALTSARGDGPATANEVYGPHADGTVIEEHPANDPRTASASPAAPGVEVYGPFFEGFWVDGVSPNDPQASRMQTSEMQPPARGAVTPRVRTENALFIWARSRWARTKSWVQAKRWAQAKRWDQTKSWVQTKPWAQTKSWARNIRDRSSSARRTFVESAWVQSLWARTRDVDLSQMMVIAGAVLLVCGGLLLGGGLILRSGSSASARTDDSAATSPQVSEEAPEGIAWTFEDDDRPLPDRAVFTLSGTPESFRINGLSVSGTNLSDQALTAARGIFKPDVQRPDLKLTLEVDRSAVPAGGADAEALAVVPANTVPPHAPFRLVFPFPPEAMDGEDGITVEEFFDSYGGLLLKFHYEIDGKQKSLIQYLPPELLQSQLDEVEAGASGS